MSKHRKNQNSRQRKPSRSAHMNWLLPAVVGALVLAVAVGAIASLRNQQGRTSAQPGTGDRTATNSALPTTAPPYPEVPRISLQDTRELLQTDQAVLIDVRSHASYEKSHAVGALSYPENEIEAQLDQLPREKLIVLYCT